MTTKNSKHTHANRTTSISFIPVLRLIATLFCTSSISSVVTSRSSASLLMPSKSFKYSLMLQSLSHSQPHALGLQA